MTTPRVAVVLPSIRPDAFLKWWQHWQPLFEPRFEKDLSLIVVWDMEDVPDIAGALAQWQGSHVQLPLSRSFFSLTWKHIRPEWKDLVPTKCDSVRNLGFLFAATELKPDIIATLDDDVFPVDNLWVDRMIHNLSRQVDPGVFFPADYPTRGAPESTPANVLLHHGLWEGVPDVYARDQYIYQPLDGKKHQVQTIPRGQLFPMCGMNIAFRKDLLPAMYFWPQKPIRRYGDIWCGLIAKRVIDLAEAAATSGSPAIFHSRLSDRLTNEEDEAAGYQANNLLWRSTVRIRPKNKTTNICRLTEEVFRGLLVEPGVENLTNSLGVKLYDWIGEIERLQK